MAGYVYLIGTPIFHWYKIGKSRIPDIRIQNIGILLPFKINIIAIWKAQNHTALESALHEMYAAHRINGEWFRFGKQQLVDIFTKIPESAKIYPSGKSSDLVYANFSNLEKDCEENEKIRFKIKRLRGNYTLEEREAKRQEAVEKQKQKRLLKQQQLQQEERRAEQPTSSNSNESRFGLIGTKHH